INATSSTSPLLLPSVPIGKRPPIPTNLDYRNSLLIAADLPALPPPVDKHPSLPGEFNPGAVGRRSIRDSAFSNGTYPATLPIDSPQSSPLTKASRGPHSMNLTPPLPPTLPSYPADAKQSYHEDLDYRLSNFLETHSDTASNRGSYVQAFTSIDNIYY